MLICRAPLRSLRAGRIVYRIATRRTLVAIRRSGAQSLQPSARADGGDCPVPGKGKSSRVIIYLSAQVECASRVGKTARAGGYKGEFVVVEYAWDWCRGQGPGERAGNTVAVGPCKYVAADIGQVADIEDEFRRSVEAAQLHRISPLTASESTWHSSRGTVEMIVPETIPLNGTWSRADAGVVAEINTAAKQARNSGIRNPATAESRELLQRSAVAVN